MAGFNSQIDMAIFHTNMVQILGNFFFKPYEYGILQYRYEMFKIRKYTILT